MDHFLSSGSEENIPYVTIFTPTYNRSVILEKLYKSLCNQTSKRFVWLVVDDGSTDDTSNRINMWISENQISIKYYNQSNKGKAMAHNRGVELTETFLFTCVDSDDYLDNRAVETIIKTDLSDHSLIGAVYKKGFSDNSATIWNENLTKSTLYNAYHELGLKGDTMLVFKTEIIKKYSFPYFEGEKFVPEAYLYDLLDQEGELLFVDKVLYFCEYLNDGYTKNIRKTIALNPRGYCEFIEQRIKIDKKLKYKVADYIRYIAISFVLRDRNLFNEKEHSKLYFSILYYLCFIPGFLFYFKEYKGYSKAIL